MAERRAQALTLDRDLLRELLGQEELRELLDPAALADLELSLQALVEERQAKTADQVHDLLRRLGDLGPDEAGARTVGGRVEASLHLAELAASRRAVRARIAGEERWIAIEDVARYRDGVGVSAPPGVPQAFLAPVAGALDGLLARYARTHGPFLGSEPARRWGLPAGVVEDALHRLVAAGSLLSGEFRPGGAEREFCDPEVLRLLRRRSLATLRREVEPVDPVTLARFLPAWQGVAAVAVRDGECRFTVPWLRGAGTPRRGRGPARRPADPRVRAGARRPPGAHPRLPAAAPRRAGRHGRGRLGGAGEPRPRRRPRGPAAAGPGAAAARRGPPDGVERPAGEIHERLRAHLRRRGACFYRELFTAAGARSDREVLDALWDLVWAGEVTNDTFAPLRALRWKRPAKDHRPRPGTADGPRAPGGRRPLVAGGRRGRGDEPTGGERRRPRARSASTPRRSSCSSATACSPARPSRARRWTVASPRSTRCCAPWRRPGGSGAGTSWTAWGPPSSRSRAPWTGCARCATSPARWPASTGASCTSWRPRIPRTRTGPRSRGRAATRPTGARSSAPPGRTSRWSTARRCSTWTAAGRRSRCCPPAEDPEALALALRSLADLVADGRVRELVIGKVDGEPVAASRFGGALLAAGFVTGYRGYALRAAPAPAERTYPRPGPVRPIR